MLKYERQHWGQGITRLAGIDEAGRGPLAGSVVAASVLMPPSYAESEADGIFSRLTDSKKLTEKSREEFFSILNESETIEIGVGVSSVDEIDEINILRATHLAMARAIEAIKPSPEHALVDGLPVKGLSCPSTAIVKGDSKGLLIAAASVIAKVTRDRMMLELDEQYPGYGFARHKGYGTKVHMDALKTLGACPVHRRSFAPVREALGLGQQNMGF